MPRERNLPPSYEQKNYSKEERNGRFRLVASEDGRDGSVTIQQDARLYAAMLKPGSSLDHALGDNRHAWIQVARGNVKVNGLELNLGDGAAVSNERQVSIAANDEAEILLFDLA